MPIRHVWTTDELTHILRAVAMAGGDPRTLAAVATALGVEPIMIGEREDETRFMAGIRAADRRQDSAR